MISTTIAMMSATLSRASPEKSDACAGTAAQAPRKRASKRHAPGRRADTADVCTAVLSPDPGKASERSALNIASSAREHRDWPFQSARLAPYSRQHGGLTVTWHRLKVPPSVSQP